MSLSPVLALVGVGMWLAALHDASAAKEEMRLCARLIWGSNNADSSKARHHEVDPGLRDKLKSVFKWSNYFEMERKTFSIPPAQEIKLSEDCSIQTKYLGDKQIEVRLFGKGRHIVTKRQSIIRDETIVLAGDAKDGTAWFVVVTLAGKKQ